MTLQTIRINTDRLWADGGAWFCAGLCEYILHAGTPKTNSIVHSTTSVKVRIVLDGTRLRNSPYVNAFFKAVRATMISLNSNGISEEQLANIILIAYKNLFKIDLVAEDATSHKYVSLTRLMDIIAIRAELPPGQTQDLFSVLKSKMVKSNPLELFWLTASWPLSQGEIAVFDGLNWTNGYIRTCDLETYTYLIRATAGFVASIENSFIDIPVKVGDFCPNGHLATAVGLATGVTNMQKPLMSTAWTLIDKYITYDTYYDRIITFPCVLTGHKGSGKSTSIDYLKTLIPDIVVIDSDDFGETEFARNHGYTLESFLLSSARSLNQEDIETIRVAYMSILPEYQKWAAMMKSDFVERKVQFVVFTHTTMEAAAWALPIYAIDHIVPPFDVIMGRSRANSPQSQLLLAITYAQMMSDANLITLHDFISGVWRGVTYLHVDQK
jgi:hypothetical protein